MNTLDKYLLRTYEVINLTIDIAGYDKEGKKKGQDEIFKNYLQNCYLTIAESLNPEDKEKLIHVVESDSEQQEKFKKINLFLEDRVTDEYLSEIIVDELENIMKKLIKAVNNSLTGEPRILYNKKIVNILTQPF